MPPGESSGKYPALRISQLDATELDGELHNILKTHFLRAFKYFPSGFLDKITPELNALLRTAVWTLSLKSSGATIGQQMLGLKYKNNNSIHSQWITSKQRYIYAILTIGVSWFQERSITLFRKIPEESSLQFIPKALNVLEHSYAVFSLINFLIFLCKGKYQLILERLLGIQVVYPERQLVRQVSFDYLSRELLWHGFAEFLFFVLPFVNFRRIKNTLSRYFTNKSTDSTRTRCPADLKQCIVCGEWPCHPQEGGCSHVFCYYCVSANLKADPSFSCPGCGHAMTDIKPVLITVGKL